MSHETSKPPQITLSDQKRSDTLSKPAVSGVMATFPTLSSTTDDRRTGGTGGCQAPHCHKMVNEWGRRPWMRSCNQALMLRHWLLMPSALSSSIPAQLKVRPWQLSAIPVLVTGRAMKPLSLQQLPRHFQLLPSLGPGGNLFLVWVESDCLSFFSIFPLSGEIIWMKENRAKITFPHSWAAAPFH